MKHKNLIRKALFFAFLIQVPAMICGIDPENKIGYCNALFNTLIAFIIVATVMFLLSICGGLNYLRDEENQTTQD